VCLTLCAHPRTSPQRGQGVLGEARLTADPAAPAYFSLSDLRYSAWQDARQKPPPVPSRNASDWRAGTCHARTTCSAHLRACPRQRLLSLESYQGAPDDLRVTEQRAEHDRDLAALPGLLHPSHLPTSIDGRYRCDGQREDLVDAHNEASRHPDHDWPRGPRRVHSDVSSGRVTGQRRP
jgi:hypothetical protein